MLSVLELDLLLVAPESVRFAPDVMAMVSLMTVELVFLRAILLPSASWVLSLHLVVHTALPFVVGLSRNRPILFRPLRLLPVPPCSDQLLLPEESLVRRPC